MYITITSIRLKSPLKFFLLSFRGMKITFQLNKTSVLKIKNWGFWTMHYTLTAWKSHDDLKTFSRTGAHLEAMKRSAELAREIRTYTYEADRLPDRREAEQLLMENGRAIVF